MDFREAFLEKYPDKEGRLKQVEFDVHRAFKDVQWRAMCGGRTTLEDVCNHNRRAGEALAAGRSIEPTEFAALQRVMLSPEELDMYPALLEEAYSRYGLSGTALQEEVKASLVDEASHIREALGVMKETGREAFPYAGITICGESIVPYKSARINIWASMQLRGDATAEQLARVVAAGKETHESAVDVAFLSAYEGAISRDA